MWTYPLRRRPRAAHTCGTGVQYADTVHRYRLLHVWSTQVVHTRRPLVQYTRTYVQDARAANIKAHACSRAGWKYCGGCCRLQCDFRHELRCVVLLTSLRPWILSQTDVLLDYSKDLVSQLLRYSKLQYPNCLRVRCNVILLFL